MFLVCIGNSFFKPAFKTEDKALAKSNTMALDFPIDTVENSSFLNKDLFRNLEDAVKECTSSLRLEVKRKRTFKKLAKFLQFVKVFSIRGRQGITGILNLKSNNKNIVFKVALQLDRSIEHESMIMKKLNSLRPFCPHFVGNLGMLEIPLSNEFISEPEEHSLFKNSDDYFPSKVMLMEYVSPVSLYHLCKYLFNRKGVVISALSQIMIALDIAQTKVKFTSYDLHLENVLVRQIEEDSLFLYKHKGENWLIPTFGFYPVIIDLASSYVEDVEGQPQNTSIDNYHRGLQPTVFDQLNDVHHLLISTLAYLAPKAYVYDHLHTMFLHLFRHVPVMATRGWKRLPHDLLKLVSKKIIDDCPDVASSDLFLEYGIEIIDLLNGLIVLPWTDGTDGTDGTDRADGTEDNKSFTVHFDPLFKELQKIYDMNAVKSSSEFLYIVRETVELVNRYRESFTTDANTLKKFIEEWKQKILFIIKKETNIPKTLDFETLFKSALHVADCLSYNYYSYAQEHCSKISEAYLKTNLRSPMDAAKVLLRNATPRFNISNNCKIYVWDADQECGSVHCSSVLSDENRTKINDVPIKKKGDLLVQFLNSGAPSSPVPPE